MRICIFRLAQRKIAQLFSVISFAKNDIERYHHLYANAILTMLELDSSEVVASYFESCEFVIKLKGGIDITLPHCPKSISIFNFPPLKKCFMQYLRFKEILNTTVFNDTTSKRDLLEKIAEKPARFIGLFRPTLPKLKLLQNLTQSQEIRFGDAFETIIAEYLAENGYTLLPRKYTWKEKELDIDQCFKKGTQYYFAEQKLRDDHDSTKKVGQFQNFENKIDLMLHKYGKNVISFMFFIDPEMVKNINYYEERAVLARDSKKIPIHIFYGKPFFDMLHITHVWEEILAYLEKWRDEIPEMPELNFDLDVSNSMEQIKVISANDFKKLFSNDAIYEKILLTLFPQKATLKLLLKHFEEIIATGTLTKVAQIKYIEAYDLLKERLSV